MGSLFGGVSKLIGISSLLNLFSHSLDLIDAIPAGDESPAPAVEVEGKTMAAVPSLVRVALVKPPPPIVQPPAVFVGDRVDTNLVAPLSFPTPFIPVLASRPSAVNGPSGIQTSPSIPSPPLSTANRLYMLSFHFSHVFVHRRYPITGSY